MLKRTRLGVRGVPLGLDCAKDDCRRGGGGTALLTLGENGS